MTIDGGDVIVLLYLLGSMGLIVAFLLAVPMVERFADRLRVRRRSQR